MFPTNQKTQLGSTFLEELATVEPGPKLQETNGSHSRGHSSRSLLGPGLPPVPCGVAGPGPGSSTRSRGRRQGVCGKQKSLTRSSPAHLATAHPFTPTQPPDSGPFRKKRGRRGACVRQREEGSRWQPMPPPQEKRASHGRADKDV